MLPVAFADDEVEKVESIVEVTPTEIEATIAPTEQTEAEETEPTVIPVEESSNTDETKKDEAIHDTNEVTTDTPEVKPTPSKQVRNKYFKRGKMNARVFQKRSSRSIQKSDVVISEVDGSATIITDKEDYAPTDTVLITGSGFDSNETYTIVITSETGNYEFRDSVQSDSNGQIFYSHQLDGTYRPNYKAEILDVNGRVVASIDFTDSRSIDSVTLNGSSKAIVTKGVTTNISAKVTVKLSDKKDYWRCTKWRLGNGPFTLVNHTDKSGKGTYDVTFDIQIPNNLSTGSHTVEFIAYSDDECTRDASSSYKDTSILVIEPNPGLPQACGLDIALVIDTSGSISSSEMSQIKNAMTAFTSALEDTPTQFSVTKFDTTASVIQSFTSDIAVVNNKITNTIPTQGNGYTNWEDGLNKAQGTFDPRNEIPNLIIFASDGNPNRVGSGGTSANEATAVSAAVTVANSIKYGGTRILAIGVGSDLDKDNMKAISGPNADTGNILTSDVITTNFNTLAQALKNFAIEMCGGTITVNKVIEDPDRPANEPPVSKAGWEFNISGQTKITDSNGETDAVGVDEGTNHSVSEVNLSAHPDYSFVTASCKKGNTSLGTLNGTSVQNISVGHNDIVGCTFTNKLNRTDISVKKDADKTTVNSGGTLTYTITVKNNSANLARNVIAKDTLPAGFVVTSVTPGSGSCSSTTQPNIQCELGDLAGNATETITIVGTLTTNVNSVTNNVKVTTDTPETNYNNNEDNETTNVVNAGDIKVVKYEDSNKNQVKDAGEVFLSGWTMTLYNGATCEGAPVGNSQSTNANGETTFTGLLPGQYSVKETMQSGYHNSTPLCQTATVVSGQTSTVIFGNYKLGQVTVCKYDDKNGDGLTTGDTKLSGWTINLVGPSNYAKSVVTSENGCATFDNLDYGTYTYSENLQSGWIETNSEKDHTVTVGVGSLIHNVELTNFKLGSISGYKWNDLDGDGEREEGEPGMGDWTIKLFKGDEELQTKQTGTDGAYTFDGLQAGSYRVCEVQQAGWTQTWPLNNGCHNITIESGSVFSTATFGNVRKGSISIVKNTLGGEGIFTFETTMVEGNVTLTTEGNTATRQFSDLLAGSYTIKELGTTGWDLTNLVCVDPDQGTSVNLTTGEATIDLDAGENIVCTYTNTKRGSITVTKVVGDESTWNFTLNDMSTPSALGNGESHKFENLKPGSYTLTEEASDDYHTSITCRNEVPGQNGYVINLVAGEEVSCVVTNTLKTADVSVVKSANSTEFMRGDTVEYTLTVENNGPDIAKSVTLTDNIPAGLTYVSATSAKGTCQENSGTITCNLGDLANGEIVVVTVKVKVTATASGAIQNTGTVSSTTPDPNEDNNTDEESITVLHLELDVDKTDDNDTVYPGNKITYTINWEVTGNTEAKNIKLVEKVNKTLVDVDLSDPLNSGWTVCGDYYCYEIGNRTTPANGTVQFVVTVKKPTNATEIPNTVELYTDKPVGEGELKDEDSETTTVLQYGSISGYKFNDINGNGVWEEEAGLSGWIIYIDENGNGKREDSEKSVITDEYGLFEFTDLLPGSYVVCEEQQEGWIQTTPNGCYVIEVAQGEDIENKNFGNFKLGSISGYKFEDKNGNGKWDRGENKLKNWKIEIWQDGVKQSTYTNSNGRFEFKGLKSGQYTVCEVLRDEWVNTLPKGEPCYTFTITSGYTEEFNFGNFKLGTIKGFKYEDNNRNGKWDRGENKLNGWNIELYDSKWQLIDSSVTKIVNGTKGQFEFNKLGLGIYYVCEVQQNGWIQTQPSFGVIKKGTTCYKVTITESGQCKDLIFGNFKLGTISGVKYEDNYGDGRKNYGDKGLENWTIKLYDKNWKLVKMDITNKKGEYYFDELDKGTYYVCEVQQDGWAQTEPVKGPEKNGTNCYKIDISNSGQDMKSKNFGNFYLGEIQGTKYEDINGNGLWDEGEEGLRNWKIRLYNDDWKKIESDSTDDNGSYKFSKLTKGTYYVCEEIIEDWVQTEPSLPEGIMEAIYNEDRVVLGENGSNCYRVKISHSGQKVYELDFGNYRNGQISGYKFEDVNYNGQWDEEEPTLEGWEIRLWNLNEEVIYPEPEVTPTTVIPTATYVPSPSGVFASTTNSGITGYISRWTDEEGRYSFEGLMAGEYMVCEVLQPGWMQTYPNNLSDMVEASAIAYPEPERDSKCWYITITSGSSEYADFGNFELGIVKGYKWNDVNGNGVKDEDEDNIEGWKIQLYEATEDSEGGLVPGNKLGEPIVTNSEGWFMFEDLEPGVYFVAEVQKTNWKQTYPDNPIYHKIVIDESGQVYEISFGNQEVKEEPITGEVLGEDTSKVLGTTDQLAKTGRNMAPSIVMGLVLLSAVLMLNTPKFRVKRGK